MRLLHTSDWHLGRSFHREDLLGAQAQFIDFLVETVESERVDAVLVSGDVYDRALPSVDAVALCNDALRRLMRTGTRVVLISGNHDSARRLGFGAELIDEAGVHLRTDPRRVGEPVLLACRDGSGDLAVYPIPYLEPDAVRADLLDEVSEGRGHAAVLGAAMTRIRADLAGRPGTRSVVLAHAFVAGGLASDSERDISVGGVSVVPTSCFHGVDYTALGHLHGAQQLSETVRYSGSPIAYSFSEEHHRKVVLLVDVPSRPGAALTVESLPTPVQRPIARLRSTIDDLLTSEQWAAYTDHYLQVTLTDAQRPRQAMARLRTRFPQTLVLAFDPAATADDAPSYAARLRGKSDLEIATDFMVHVRSTPSDDESALLARALATVRADEVAV
jgi:DNA repair protein SbcD/Mre11